MKNLGLEGESLVTECRESATVRQTVRKADMNHALLLNLAIIGLIVIALLITNNPLALLAVVFLKEMPYGLLAQDEEEEESSRKIGFIIDED